MAKERGRPERGLRRSRPVTQPLEVAACLSLVLACTASGQRASWRHDQELLIVEAVLLDLAEMPPMSDGDLRTVFCVGVGENIGTSAQDPEPALLEALRRKRANVLPASSCEMKRTLMRRGGSEHAILLGVGQLEWKSDGFVHVVGWRFVSPAAAAEYAYTLSLSQGRWTVDTCKLISFA